MRRTIIATAIAILGFGVSVAEAMPTAPIGTPAAKNTVLVDYACGRGFHITPWGNCRPNWRGPPPRRYGWDDRRPPRHGWRYERSYGWDNHPPRWDRRGGYDNWR